jgi:hypothetical protein
MKRLGRGIFGRGVTEYCWPCGFRAIVKFRQVLGENARLTLWLLMGAARRA